MLRRMVLIVGLALIRPVVVHAHPGLPASRLAELRAATDTVRHFFEALGQNDFGSALRLTNGEALARTSKMLGDLQASASRHAARVELRIKALDLQPVIAAGPPTPIAARFDIDVVGHKAIFHKVAKRLSGTVQFFVDTNAAPVIVAIEGRFD